MTIAAKMPVEGTNSKKTGQLSLLPEWEPILESYRMSCTEFEKLSPQEQDMRYRHLYREISHDCPDNKKSN